MKNKRSLHHQGFCWPGETAEASFDIGWTPLKPSFQDASGLHPRPRGSGRLAFFQLSEISRPNLERLGWVGVFRVGTMVVEEGHKASHMATCTHACFFSVHLLAFFAGIGCVACDIPHAYIYTRIEASGCLQWREVIFLPIILIKTKLCSVSTRFCY